MRRVEAAHHRLLPPVLLALTATTGVIDTVSYLGLGHVSPRSAQPGW